MTSLIQHSTFIIQNNHLSTFFPIGERVFVVGVSERIIFKNSRPSKLPPLCKY